MNKRTTIKEVMTPCPHSIGPDQSISKAREVMRQYSFRHLPVQKGGQLIGIVTSRDIDFMLAMEKGDPHALTVEDAYMPDPYIVDPNTLLADVVAYLGETKIGCALIVDTGKLLGVYTTVDACRDFAHLIKNS